MQWIAHGLVKAEVKFLHFTEFIKIIPVVFRIKTEGGGVVVVVIVIRFAIEVVLVLVRNLDLGTAKNPSCYRSNLQVRNPPKDTNLQLLVNVDGVEGAAEPVVRPPHLEQLSAGNILSLPLARQDHVLAALHRLKP